MLHDYILAPLYLVFTAFGLTPLICLFKKQPITVHYHHNREVKLQHQNRNNFSLVLQWLRFSF